MSTYTSTVTDADTLVERARAVVPVLAANAARTEGDLCPAPDSVAAVREAGLFALTAPVEAGGSGAGVHTLARVGLELGRGCPSTAWVTSLSGSAKGMVARMLGEEGRRVYLADPDAVACASALVTGAAEEVDGEVRLTGRWRMTSGSELAGWAWLVTPLLRDGRPVTVGGVVVPVADLRIERSWRGAGLAGTSSHTLVADGLVVPEAFRIFAPEGVVPELPDTFVAGAVTAHLAPMVGAARGALDIVTALLNGDKAPFQTSYARLKDSPLARHWYAEATHLVDDATRRLLDVAARLDAVGPAGAMSLLDRSTARRELVTAAGQCRSALALLLDLHGAGGFDDGNPLQRFWRDVEVGTRYAGLNPFIAAEDHARLLLDAGDLVTQMF